MFDSIHTARLAGLTLRLAAALLFLALLSPSNAVAAETGGRVALVIGNANYEATRALANPLVDARLIADSLKAVGFTSVTVVRNVRRDQMYKAVKDFSLLADKAEVALIYYAGHGMEVNGTNYLLPVDVRLARDRDAELEAIKLDTLLEMTQGARRLRVIILDACRNNPFDATMTRSAGSRAASRGLAPIEPAGDSLVVYAAKAGKTAADGSSTNSPFARALARRLIEPGNEVNLLFRKVRDDVMTETSGEQEPFTYGSLSSREFYFRAPASRFGAVDLETEAWDLCKSGRSRAPCDGYLASHTNGKFAALARAKLADFSSSSAAAVRAPPQAVPLAPIASETVRQLGLSVRASDDRSGIIVQAISEDGPAFGQLLPGDMIVAINSAQVQRAISPGSQLSGALGTGRIKLLVRRGASTSVVIVRAAQPTNAF